MAVGFRVAGVGIPVHLRTGFRLAGFRIPSGTRSFSLPDIRIRLEPEKHRRGTLPACSNRSSGEKVWPWVMKNKALDPFLCRSSGSRKMAGHVVRTGRPSSPVDVLWNALHHRKFVFFYTFCLSHKWSAGICDTLFLRDSCPWNNHIRQCCREVMGNLPHPTPAWSETSVRLQCSQVYASVRGMSLLRVTDRRGR